MVGDGARWRPAEMRNRQATSLLVLVVIWVAVPHACGQGYVPSQRGHLGSSGSSSALKQQYQLAQSKTSSPSAALAAARAASGSARAGCLGQSGRSGGPRAAMCGSAATASSDAYAALMLDASPAAWSSTSPEHTGKLVLVAPAGDQLDCQTCLGFAVASAAETAVAAAMRVNVSEVSISVQALVYCSAADSAGPVKTCQTGWNFFDALVELERRARTLPTAQCLPYRPDPNDALSRREMCQAKCNTTSSLLEQGTFFSKQLGTVWQVQRYIRLYGAVVSNFVAYNDFEPFFEDKRNAKAVYRPRKDAKVVFEHAVQLVGYNNSGGYWLAKNSWGPDWADDGLFRVAYGECNVLSSQTSEVYAVGFEPAETPKSTKLPAMAAPSKPGCFLYKARQGDYLSRIADVTRIPLDKLLEDNIDAIKDLRASLAGTRLLLCKPAQGSTVLTNADGWIVHAREDPDEAAELLMAASPPAWSSTNLLDTGGLALVAPPGDQGACATSPAFAVASAAEIAVAAAMRVNVSEISISVAALYFCPVSGGPARNCESGWTFEGALKELEQRASTLPTARCLAYTPAANAAAGRRELCEAKCNTSSRLLEQGLFKSVPITSVARAQQHIRMFGAVVSSFTVYDDLVPFYDDKGNAKAVYRPRKDAIFAFSQAVVLVGYNNTGGYWLVKNSWGRDWADGGFFRVAYGECGVLQQGDAYGIKFTPKQAPAAAALPAAAAPSKPGCFLYKAQQGDYLSRIADVAGIPLRKLLADNVAAINKDLGMPLAGTQLLLCGAVPGSVKLETGAPRP